MINDRKCPICGNAHFCACDTSSYQDSIDIVQAQTRNRINRENETYRQQQERLARTKRRGCLCAVLIVIGLFAALAGRLYWSTRP